MKAIFVEKNLKFVISTKLYSKLQARLQHNCNLVVAYLALVASSCCLFNTVQLQLEHLTSCNQGALCTATQLQLASTHLQPSW